MSILFFAGFASACASIPDVEYSYYLSKSTTVVTVAQTIDCSSDKHVVVVHTPTVATSYAADLDRGPYRINLRDVEGAFRGFADSDASFGFYDDGRLKNINQSTTGQGEAIIKSAVSLGSALAPLGGGNNKAADTTAVCKIIADWGGGKPVSLSYGVVIDLGNALGQSLPILVTPGSKQLFDALNTSYKLPILAISIGKPSDLGSRARYFPSKDSIGDVVALTLQDTASIKVQVTVDGSTIWTANVTVPEGSTYSLPIPKAALFGKQTFSLSLTEAGAISAVDYGKTSGAAGALNAANTIATALDPETTAAKAADLKAQADIIAQQQRLIGCQTKPADCK